MMSHTEWMKAAVAFAQRRNQPASCRGKTRGEPALSLSTMSLSRHSSVPPHRWTCAIVGGGTNAVSSLPGMPRNVRFHPLRRVGDYLAKLV
jgi:hypothetical protein